MNITNMEENTKKLYYFFSLADQKKEKIAQIRSESYEWAEQTFATLKGLGIDEFRKIYGIQEL